MATYVKEMISKLGNVFKNMVGDIVRQCNIKNVELSANVITYCVILFFIDPLCGVKDPDNITGLDIDIFVENCVSKLSDTNSAYIKSLQLQFICLEIRSEVITISDTNLFEGNLTEKHAKLIKEITEMMPADYEIEEIYKNMVFDIIISNRLGKPSTPQTIKEVTNALKSVLHVSDCQEFIKMNKEERLQRLKNLRMIVCGIMIYNHWEGEVGEEIANILKDVDAVYKKVKYTIIYNYESTIKVLRRLQQAGKNIFRVNTENNKIIYLHKNVNDVDILRGVMQLYVQYGDYLNKMLLITNKQNRRINQLIHNWHNIISEIRKMVIYRIPITVDIIFPLFIKLSLIWHNLWEYLKELINIYKIVEEMIQIFETDILEVTAKFDYALNKKVEKKKPTIHLKKSPVNIPGNCEWISYEYESEHVKNLGPRHRFCSYLLICGDGILIPSNLYNGLIKYNNHYYTFSDAKYIKPFTNNPQYFETKFMLLIRSNPHLIAFFDMYDIIRNYKIIETEDEKSSYDEYIEEKTKSIDIQTELHPIPYYKNKTYTWNAWDLRKRAVQLANIKNCVTHSSQTDTTYYRYSTKLQTNQIKQDNVETKKNASVNTQTNF